MSKLEFEQRMRLFQAEGNWEKSIPKRREGKCKAELGSVTWYIQVNTPLQATEVKRGMWDPWKQQWAPNVNCCREADMGHEQNIPQRVCDMEVNRDLALNGINGQGQVAVASVNVTVRCKYNELW